MANAVQRFGKSHDGNLASYGLKTTPAVPSALTTQAVQKLQKVSASQVRESCTEAAETQCITIKEWLVNQNLALLLSHFCIP